MRKNVLFILLDSLRADKCYGENRSVCTPHINSLIKKGAFFSKTIAATTVTTPSVASIFTGLYPFAHGIRALNGYKLGENIDTLAQVFKNNGYHTYAEVTGPLLSITGLDKGFDNYNYRGRKSYLANEWGKGLIAKFKNRQFKEPWFIFIHLWELHYPRFIPKEFNSSKFGKNRYERALSALDATLGNLFKEIDFNNTTILIHGDHGEKILENIFDEYLWSFGKKIRNIIEALKESYNKFMPHVKIPKILKLRRPKLNRPFGHGFSLYDDVLIVPLVIAGSIEEFFKGKSVSAQVRQVDIFPTIIDLFNLSNGAKYEIGGQSLLPLIKGKDFDISEAYCEARGPVLIDKKYWQAGLRTQEYKFVYRPYGSKKFEELYNLEKDPLEKNNIIKKQPEIARFLKERLHRITCNEQENAISAFQRMTKEEENILIKRLRSLGYIG